MTSEQSSPISGKLLATFDRDSLCWKTSEASLLGEAQKSLPRLPPTGMTTSDGLLFEQATPMHLIEERAGSVLPLLPTPVVNDMGDDKTLEWWHDWIKEKRLQHNNSNGHGKSLSVEARLMTEPYDDGSTPSDDQHRLL